MLGQHTIFKGQKDHQEDRQEDCQEDHQSMVVEVADMNVLPLGSYDVLIGMDWLEAHKVKLDYYNKTFEYMDEEGNLVVLKGISKVISVR